MHGAWMMGDWNRGIGDDMAFFLIHQARGYPHPLRSPPAPPAEGLPTNPYYPNPLEPRGIQIVGPE